MHSGVGFVLRRKCLLVNDVFEVNLDDLESFGLIPIDKGTFGFLWSL